MGDLSEHFSTHEVACKCGCGFAGVDWLTLWGMEALRERVGGIPIRPTSVCRCREHNAKELRRLGLPDSGRISQHTHGRACDFSIHDFYDITEDPIYLASLIRSIPAPQDLQSLLKRPFLFTGIGVYPWGCHADTRTGSRVIVWGPLSNEFKDAWHSPGDLHRADEHGVETKGPMQ